MGIPVPVLVLIAVTIGATAIAQRHRFGRHVFAVGGDPESAKLVGINTQWVTVRVFALMGLLCGLAAIVLTARLNAAASGSGTMMELYVISAAVIGGTSLAGGVGTILGGAIGALVMQSLQSGMVLMGVPSPNTKHGPRRRPRLGGLGRHAVAQKDSDMNTPLIETRGLSKSFGGVHAVEDVDVSLGRGEVVALLGHNGAGKSTLIKMLSGVIVADEGSILVNGKAAPHPDARGLSGPGHRDHPSVAGTRRQPRCRLELLPRP